MKRQRKEQKTEFIQGVFEYSGLGMGTYWSEDGPVFVSPSEAAEMAREEGVELIRIDRERQSSGYTHNWRDYVKENTMKQQRKQEQDNLIEIPEDVRIPGTDVILEKGDKVEILKEDKDFVIEQIQKFIDEGKSMPVKDLKKLLSQIKDI